MKKETVEAILINADWLVKRACRIGEDAPYWKGGSIEECWAKLSIDGDEATLQWPELESGYYGDSGIVGNSFKFPCGLLFMDDADLEKWKAEQRILYERNERERKKKAKEEAKIWREREERRAYDILKQKYG